MKSPARLQWLVYVAVTPESVKQPNAKADASMKLATMNLLNAVIEFSPSIQDFVFLKRSYPSVTFGVMTVGNTDQCTDAH